MDVLAHVDTARPKVREQHFERRDLLIMPMATVVNDHIKPFGSRLHNRPKKAPVSLIPDEDGGGSIVVGTAGWFEIDPVQLCTLSEIVVPHPEAAPLYTPISTTAGL